jgi:serine/threonine protein kinase
VDTHDSGESTSSVDPDSCVDPYATRPVEVLVEQGDERVLNKSPDVQQRATENVLMAVQRYRILKPLAQGGLGRVYLARDEELGRDVALKQIIEEFADGPDFQSRFLFEAHTCANLEHPGIVAIYGIGRDSNGRPFIPMRLIRGRTFRDAIREFHMIASAKPNPAEQTLALQRLLKRFIDACNAVAFAHSRGIIHQDIKPGNIMLGKYGETILVDWGLAKILYRPGVGSMVSEGPEAFHPDDYHGKTRAGAVVGTPAYMSPEQASGRWDLIEPASDVYSLGATLYEILTGRVPFERGDVPNILLRVRQGLFPKPHELKPDIPAVLEAICLKAMSLQPEDRYASPLALADDIERSLAGAVVSAQGPPTKQIDRYEEAARVNTLHSPSMSSLHTPNQQTRKWWAFWK